jgi:putative nucleotidyltransferase with HDIG domain
MSETLAPRAQAILRLGAIRNLRKHCYAVADSMKHFAQLRGEDADLWEAVGLLHDMDYERHPNLERSATEGHPFVGVAWLPRERLDEEVCRDSFARRLFRRFARNALEKLYTPWTS